MPPNPLVRFRKMALELPEAHEVESWGAPTFRVKNKIYAMYSSPKFEIHKPASRELHPYEQRPGVWLKAGPGNQQLMMQFAPDRFFVPPYVGKGGWIGVYLDKVCNWTELRELVSDAYRLTAPKKLLAQLDDA